MHVIAMEKEFKILWHNQSCFFKKINYVFILLLLKKKLIILLSNVTVNREEMGMYYTTLHGYNRYS